MAPLSKFTPQITPSPTTPSESETTANILTQQPALTKERIIAAEHGGLTLGTKTTSHQESHNWPSNNHGTLSPTSTLSQDTSVNSTQSSTTPTMKAILSSIQGTYGLNVMTTNWLHTINLKNVTQMTGSPAENTEENTAVPPITSQVISLPTMNPLMERLKLTSSSVSKLAAKLTQTITTTLNGYMNNSILDIILAVKIHSLLS